MNITASFHIRPEDKIEAGVSKDRAFGWVSISGDDLVMIHLTPERAAELSDACSKLQRMLDKKRARK